MTRQDILAIAKPILFNTEMTKAILDNRKTVTRRAIKPQPETCCEDGFIYDKIANNLYCKGCGNPFINSKHKECMPKYQIGDYLYVQETFCPMEKYFGESNKSEYCYKANSTKLSEECRKQYGIPWSPSIHMPKEAARLFLHVTDIRVERLQDITEEQAKAEGTMFFTPSERYNQFHSKWLNGLCSDCEYANPFTLDGCSDMGRKLDLIESCGCTSHFLLRNDYNSLEPARLRFFAYLDSLASKTNNFDMFHTNNPWVWVIEFERVETDE